MARLPRLIVPRFPHHVTQRRRYHSAGTTTARSDGSCVAARATTAAEAANSTNSISNPPVAARITETSGTPSPDTPKDRTNLRPKAVPRHLAGV